MLIKDIFLTQIFDSRGEATLEVSLGDGDGRLFFASVPSGKSRGSHEAAVLPYAQAKAALGEVRSHVIGKSYPSVAAFDNALLALDGTENKSKLGGNLMLGLSVAFARAHAFASRKILWGSLRDEFFPGVAEKWKPLVFSNLVNGGMHARNNLQIQEYMVVLKTGMGSFKETVPQLIGFYRDLGDFLAKEKRTAMPPIGDEGGYAMNFTNNFEPIAILEERLKEAKMDSFCTIGLDAAATDFYGDGAYLFEGKRFQTDELARVYEDYFKRSKLLCTIEDPFAETDEKGFAMLLDALHGKWVVGDDLTTTHPKLIERYAEQKCIKGAIIKPNQIGTVSEACAAINAAKKNGVKTIISHRSGETEDTFIIHLAKAAAADAVKIGAPARERMLKFNELLRVYG